MSGHSQSRFIAAMDLLQEEVKKGPLTLQRVLDILAEEGHGMVLLFLCLPFLQPIPLPGISTPLGLMMIIVGFLILRDQPAWVPKRFSHHVISSELLIKVSETAEKIWTYIAKIVKQRWSFLIDYRFFKALNFVVLTFNCVLLALPLPIPFSNTVPVIAIIAIAIANMEKDGFLVVFSYFWSVVVALFFAGLTAGVVKVAF